MGGGGDQQPWRDSTADLDLMGEKGGCSNRGARPVHHYSHVSFGVILDTLPMDFYNSVRRALGLNLSLSQVAMPFVIFS